MGADTVLRLIFQVALPPGIGLSGPLESDKTKHTEKTASGFKWVVMDLLLTAFPMTF
jgi:hypothetical protein